jgi:hypothetical protein
VTKSPRWQLPRITLPHIPLNNLGFFAPLVAVFVAGLLGGTLLRRLPKLNLRGLKLPSLHLRRSRAEEQVAAQQQVELEQGIDALDQAVAAEPPRKAKSESKSVPAPAPAVAEAGGTPLMSSAGSSAPVETPPPRSSRTAAEPAAVAPTPVMPPQVADVEQEMKESLMDRRVRRVLELNKEGRSIAAIAEELQMGQDEVKLILDLNQ